jgi:hypothetical protein
VKEQSSAANRCQSSKLAVAAIPVIFFAIAVNRAAHGYEDTEQSSVL